jgi:hypothetical protein
VDLLLTDVVMPDLDGHALYERLRQRFPELRVLYMSGYAGPFLGEELGAESVSPIVQKPFSKRSLQLRVREALDQPPPTSSPVTPPPD